MSLTWSEILADRNGSRDISDKSTEDQAHSGESQQWCGQTRGQGERESGLEVWLGPGGMGS